MFFLHEPKFAYRLGQILRVNCLSAWLLAATTFGLGATAADATLQSFENLFRELQVSESQAEDGGRVDRGALAPAIDRIVDARNNVFNRDGGLFDTVLNTGRVEREYLQAVAAANAAASQLASARNKLAQEHAESIRRQQETPGLRRAQIECDQAEANLRAKQGELQGVATRLGDLYARLRRNVPEFFRQYAALRHLLPFERGPMNTEIIDLLRRRERDCGQWIEGQILMAVAAAYAGDTATADACLERASRIMKECPPLIMTSLAEDCCSTWLLLGETDKVEPYVKVISVTPARSRTAMQEWILGADARVRGRHDDAAKFLAAAVGKAKKRAPPSLIAEAALSLLLADVKGRRTGKAADLLDDVKDEEIWSVLQSRAALAAAQERWGDAVHLIEACRAKAPPCLDAQLEAQHTSYANEEVWRP